MSSEVRLRLLGGFDAVGVDASAFGSRKVRIMLARLALAGGLPVDVPALTDALWPEQPPASPADQLAVLASRARGVIGRDRLTFHDAGYALHLDWLDVDALDELIDEAERRLTARQPTSARAAATAAVALCRGSLLPEEPDAEWVVSRRQVTDRRATRAQHLLAETALLGGAPVVAIEATQTALDRDPYDETALRLLLMACAAAGRPATGLMAYDRTRRLLADELGVDPGSEVRRLHLELLQGNTAAIHTAAPAHLPGRDDELAALESALNQVVATGLATIVEVVGEAGIGKTRLLDTFAEHVGGRAVVGRARCDEHRRTLVLQPVIDALTVALDATEPALRRTALDAQPLVAPLLGAASGLPGLGHGEYQPLVFRGLADVLATVAVGGPAVLLFDDIHLADSTTLSWIEIATARSDWPVLIVLSRRIEQPVSLDPAIRIELAPLDEPAVAEVVGSARAAALLRRTNGHPLFLALLADSAVQDDELPSRLIDSITRLVAEAGDAAATLYAAAVIGPRINPDLLAQVIDSEMGEILDHLEAGVRRRLLVADDLGFAFTHALVREGLVAATTASRRAWLHRQTATALATRSDADPAELAYHARLAGERRLAAQGLMLAADIAAQRFANLTALELLDEALRLSPSAEIQRRRVRVLIRLSRNADAAEAATNAVATEPDAASYECLAQAVYYSGRDCERAADLARVAAEKSIDPAQVLRCLALTGRALHGLGRLRDADAVLDEAERRSAAATTLPDARLFRGALRFHQGRSPEAVELLTTNAAATDPLAFTPVMGAMMRGLAYAELGNPIAALADFDRFAALAEQHQLARYAGRVENCRGHVLRNLGRVDEAKELHERAAEAAGEINQLEPQAHAMLDLADIALDACNSAAVAELLDRADHFATNDHIFRWRHVLRSTLLRARLLITEGDPGRAAELTADLVSQAEAEGVRRYIVLGRLTHASARHLDGAAVDLDEVYADLCALDGVAGMDGWRVTQDVATRFGVRAWEVLAEQRVGALLARAGELGGQLLPYARTRN